MLGHFNQKNYFMFPTLVQGLKKYTIIDTGMGEKFTAFIGIEKHTKSTISFTALINFQ